MKVSVIIPTRNRVQYLERLLYNLSNQLRPPDEVIITGHRDDIRTQEFLHSLRRDENIFSFKLKYKFVRGGTSKLRNIAIELSNGDIIVLLDDDVVLPKDYIKDVEKIFSDNPDVKIVTGYTFDIVDIVTPWLLKRGDIEYIWKNPQDELVKLIHGEVSQRYPEKIEMLKKKTPKCYIWFMLKTLRNLVKTIFLWEFPIKGKILPSGYRSELPDIKTIDRNGGLMEVEWIQGGNFAAKRGVLKEFKFNEDFETISEYALNEDLEWSARVLERYRIIVSSKIKLVHLRAPSTNRIDGIERLRVTVISTYYTANIRWGTMGRMSHLWATIGVVLLLLMTGHIFAASKIFRLACTLSKNRTWIMGEKK